LQNNSFAVGVMAPPSSDRKFQSPMLCILSGIAAAVLSAAGIASAADAAPKSKPQRIVSLSLCIDELVLRLADRPNVASVTWLSRAPANSNVAELSAQVPVNHGLAEEIIPLNPDLVLAGTYTTRTAVGLLKRTGIPLMELDVPNSIAGVRQQYRDIAAVLGERDNGERIVANMDARLARLAVAVPAARLRAIVLNPNGFTVGQKTLANEIMTRAGLDNVAGNLGIDYYHQFPLETVVTQGVEILIVSASRDGPPALAVEVLKHPVIAQMSDRVRVVVMPTRMWTCAGPAVVDAIELLMNAAKDVPAKARQP
jgi:iron complex transport system substrate-binding protein